MKSHLRFISFLSIAFILAVSAIGVQTPRSAGATGSIIYVNDDASGTFDGTSWNNAYKRLQNALAVASSGDQIWVAEGVYYPDEGATQTNNEPAEAFILVNGVEVYGGFDGTEALLTDRNPSANTTILSGDIDKDDANTDGNNIAETTADVQGTNAYHIIRDLFTNLDSTTILDGFVITAGYTNGNVLQSNTTGGGIQLLNLSSPTLANLVVIGNHALANGGGMFNGESSNPTLTNVSFISNNANLGGGMYNDDSDPTLTNVTFDGNSAESGGGMTNANSSSPVLTNVIFNSNSAGINGGGGGMTVSSDSAPSLTNVTFSGNSAGVGGGMYMTTLSNPYLTNVTFSGNSADYGGGIYISGNLISGPAYITARNSTFSNNDATQYGGGVYSYFGDVQLINVTFSGNSAGSAGGGLYNTNTTATNLVNTLIGNSTGGDCVNVNGSGTSGWYSLIEDSSNACGLTNGATGNIIGLDPNLGLLQNNGGFTETHALLSGSPAINTGDNASCLSTDQRDLPRPNGPRCDIGAFETLTAPQLTYPANGELLLTIRPTFDWEDFASAIGYNIQISRNNTFTQLLGNASLNGATNSAYTPTNNLPANSDIYWRVRAKLGANTYGGWSEIRTFHTGNPPGTPVLSAPANNALVASNPPPLFNWNNSALPGGTIFDKYQIQVSTSNTFEPTVIDAFTTPADITDSDYMPNPGILTSANTYYWRVRSFAADGDYSAWSLTRSVKTKYVPPTLLSPTNLSAVINLRPAFTWSAVTGASGYTIQLSRSPSFGLGTTNANVLSPTYTPGTNLTAHTTYYWRVRVKGAYGPSDWSVTFSFTTP